MLTGVRWALWFITAEGSFTWMPGWVLPSTVGGFAISSLLGTIAPLRSFLQ